MPGNPTKTVETYALVTHPMTQDDIAKLHELSVGVGWVHRAEDWELMLSLGQGIFATDEIGRAVASAMYFPMGEDLATIGMVITAPRFQEYGTASWMMGQILAKVGERDLILNATQVAYRLYYSLGFRPVATVFQHQGLLADTLPEAAPPEAGPPESGTIRALAPDDAAAVHALDARGFGGRRDVVLNGLLAVSGGTVLVRDGALAGYALCRPFGRGHVIGPVIAETAAEAIALIAPLLAARKGQFVRMDTREKAGPLREFLKDCGLRLSASASTMARGGRKPAEQGLRVLGLATQALG